MPVETDLFTAIYNATVAQTGNRIYRKKAPAVATAPYITFEQQGGSTLNSVDGSILDKHNGRFLVSVWATSYDSAIAISRLIAPAMIAATSMNAEPSSEPIADEDFDTGLYGIRQYFDVWY